MSGESKLIAKKRSGQGSAECRRLRNAGMAPGNVYGHKEGAVPIQVDHDEVHHIVTEGHIAVDLDVEGKLDKAIFREVQWDTFGRSILHFDLLRVDPDERIEVEVPVELRGTAPGIQEGGIQDVQLHTLHARCLVYKIPSSVVVRIGGLHLEQAIRVSDLSLPDGVEILNAPESVVVQINKPRGAKSAEDEESAEGAEPELIGKKDEDEGEE